MATRRARVTPGEAQAAVDKLKALHERMGTELTRLNSQTGTNIVDAMGRGKVAMADLLSQFKAEATRNLNLRGDLATIARGYSGRMAEADGKAAADLRRLA